ncbi:hypothetical protein [Paenibacillus sp. Soil766]|uniref:hypothetical protein n=1 Tax=Paenibacillus sp. Soil766 TaxID=1736404 RepID=UPI000A9AC309|nr:hypothetical protein [Paenibacillus sp. Soil766]
MAEMTNREYLVAMMDRLNEIGADLTAMKEILDRTDRRLENIEDKSTPKEQD